jgi:hypothetical protein
MEQQKMNQCAEAIVASVTNSFKILNLFEVIKFIYYKNINSKIYL